MFLIREAEPRDVENLYHLAGVQNFINLPHDRGALTKKVARSVASFRSRQVNPAAAEYMFVLEDTEKKRLIGTSMIIGQHGTPEEPHTYFEVLTKKKVSKSIHVGFLHQVLRLGFDYNGPSEIGGLVLLPEYRGRPEKLGKLLSFARFVYMAARRPQFRNEVLSELMPPFNDKGESPIWEEIGRKFTNLRYIEADRISRRNKEFITSLFPEGDIYTCMLSAEAREAIGQVSQDTQPVKKMLEHIGFSYRQMIDPFDGGPHYWAKTDKIEPVRKTRRMKVGKVSARSKTPDRKHLSRGILMTLSKKGVRAAYMELQLKGHNELVPEASIVEAMNLEDNTEVYFLGVEL